MKTKILLLVLLSTLNLPPATGFGQTNPPYVVDIITLHTNNGVVTKGDTLPVAFGKVNSNAVWFQLQLAAGLTNGSGGGVTNVIPTNGVSIVIGSTLFLNTNGLSGGNINGTNPIFTNSVTIVNPNVVNYSLLSVTVSGYSNACINGTYTNDATACVLTNQCGFIFSLINPDGSGTINGGATNLNTMVCLAAMISGVTVNTNMNGLYLQQAGQIVLNNVNNGSSTGTNYFQLHVDASSLTMFCKPANLGYQTGVFSITNINTSFTMLTMGSPYVLNGAGYWQSTPQPNVTFFITNTPAQFIPSFMCNTHPTPIAGGSSTVSFPYAIIQGNGTETSGVYTNYTITVVSGNSGINTPKPTSYIGLQTDCCNQNALGGAYGGWGIYDPLQNLCKIVVTPTQTNNICNCCYPTNLAPVAPLSPP
jgi:hypothetical protein